MNQKINNSPNARKLIHSLSPAEWVCLLFVASSLIRFALSGPSIQKNALKWEAFPKTDLLLISLAVLTLKFFRGQTLKIGLLISTAMVSYFGFLSRQADSIIPIQNWMGPQLKELFELIRWPMVFIFVAVFTQPLKGDQKLLQKLLKQIRLILPVFIMPMIYPLMPLIIQATRSVDQDENLQKIDRLIFMGHDPILLFEKLIHPFLSEWMAFSYSFYGLFFLLTFSFLYLRDEEAPTKELVFNATLTFALGYLGYTLVPAKGPLFMQQFQKSLDIYYMKDIQYALGDHARIERDCFPSLHTAITCITAYSAYKHLRRFFLITLLITASIPIACIYLRYHYVIDILAGVALSIFVIKIVPRLRQRFQRKYLIQNSP